MSSHRPENIDPSVRITMHRDHDEPELSALIYDALAVELSFDPEASLHLDTEYWMTVWTGPGLPPGIEAAPEQVPETKPEASEGLPVQVEIPPSLRSERGTVFALDPAWLKGTLELIQIDGPTPLHKSQPEPVPELEKTQLLPVVKKSIVPSYKKSMGPAPGSPFARRPMVQAAIQPPPHLSDNRPVPEVTAIIEPPPLIPAGESSSTGGST